jgi:threonine/homoserine/homoserine lactone efflux protein
MNKECHLARRGIMAADYSKSKRKPIGKMLVFGICSAIIYVAVLSYQGLITAYFTRGALYAILPIAGAFTLSYVHGHFTGYFWSVLGIEARRKSVVQKHEAERTDLRERPQPQPRMRAGL